MATQTNPNAPTQTAAGRAWIGTETVKTRLGPLEFKDGYPTGDGFRWARPIGIGRPPAHNDPRPA